MGSGGVSNCCRPPPPNSPPTQDLAQCVNEVKRDNETLKQLTSMQLCLHNMVSPPDPPENNPTPPPPH